MCVIGSMLLGCNVVVVVVGVDVRITHLKRDGIGKFGNTKNQNPIFGSDVFPVFEKICLFF